MQTDNKVDCSTLPVRKQKGRGGGVILSLIKLPIVDLCDKIIGYAGVSSVFSMQLLGLPSGVPFLAQGIQ